ncbi:4Fe-4S ferredoxin iron-sulfur binding domain protein [Methanosalsum zhilinae DSM 4017]|uniref:4Fe-4S ferredoxin iron-sulfur binding domain protein n=1 Tax=Methanosalsum zhilinae (strain DSM 4017 / NBRC 107636 / OCM 62 / WeN5) TaxID=679901 RepID=F7XK95_METZD|nr:4Fe-4S binding protein [Methanosalsum zhilinae]AEH60561.1 4Fe-4S ferredoxin iron-sulfur binding domain protein [Methanosalsum zhilinae DSM 4017]
MLKITPYLGILVLIVSIFGFLFPLLGYLVPIVFITLLLIAPFKGRWFCGNLCPRGSFVDFWIGKITKNVKIPDLLRSYWIRIPIFILLMGFMGYRLLLTEGLINQIGMVFVIMCAMTTAIAIVLGVSVAPRTWCTFCPMGTVQRTIGGNRHQLQFNENRCIECKKCDQVCPMQLEVNVADPKPDCIKCERCIDNCPVTALKI